MIFPNKSVTWHDPVHAAKYLSDYDLRQRSCPFVNQNGPEYSDRKIHIKCELFGFDRSWQYICYLTYLIELSTRGSAITYRACPWNSFIIDLSLSTYINNIYPICFIFFLVIVGQRLCLCITYIYWYYSTEGCYALNWYRYTE